MIDNLVFNRSKVNKIIIILIVILNPCLLNAKLNNLIYYFNKEIVNYFTGNEFDTILTNRDFYLGYNYGSIFKKSYLSAQIKYYNNFDSSFLNLINIPIEINIGNTQKYRSIIIVFNSFFQNYQMLPNLRNRFFGIDSGKYIITTFLEDENKNIFPIGISSLIEKSISVQSIQNLINIINEILFNPSNLYTKYKNKNSNNNISERIDFLKNEYKLWKLSYGNESDENAFKINNDFIYISFKNNKSQELAFSFILEKNTKSWNLDKIFLYKYSLNE